MRLRTIGGIWRDTRGGAALVFALGLPLVVGGLGLGVEVGTWYLDQRKLQNAADVGAYAAATELRAGRERERMRQSAEVAARNSGYDDARGTIEVTTPVRDNANQVEVRVREHRPRIFSILFGREDVVLAGRAVAELLEGVPTCVLALHPTARGAISFDGSADATVRGCNIHANSLADNSIEVSGSRNNTIALECISTAGGIRMDRNRLEPECGPPREYARQVRDPFAELSTPSELLAAPCESTGSRLKPGRYCHGLKINGTVTFEPGVYVIDGDIDIAGGADLRGEDVTFYITGNGKFDPAGNATIRLTASSSGPYAGVLLFTHGTGTHAITGTPDSLLEGAFYAPNGRFDLRGNTGSGGCFQVVASTVTLTGNSSLSIDCRERYKNAGAVRAVRLVE